MDIDALLDELEEEEDAKDTSRKQERPNEFRTSTASRNGASRHIAGIAEDSGARRIPPDPAPSAVRLKANAQLLLSMANFSESTSSGNLPQAHSTYPAPPPAPMMPIHPSLQRAPVSVLAEPNNADANQAKLYQATSSKDRSINSEDDPYRRKDPSTRSKGYIPTGSDGADLLFSPANRSSGNSDLNNPDPVPTYGCTKQGEMGKNYRNLEAESTNAEKEVTENGHLKAERDNHMESSATKKQDDLKPFESIAKILPSYPTLPTLNVVNRLSHPTSPQINRFNSDESVEKTELTPNSSTSEITSRLEETSSLEVSSSPKAQSNEVVPEYEAQDLHLHNKQVEVIRANPGLSKDFEKILPNSESANEKNVVAVMQDVPSEQGYETNQEPEEQEKSLATPCLQSSVESESSRNDLRDELNSAIVTETATGALESRTPENKVARSAAEDQANESQSWKMEASPHPVGFKIIDPNDHLDVSDSELEDYLGGLDNSTIQVAGSPPAYEARIPQSLEQPVGEIGIDTTEALDETEFGSADTSTEFISPREAMEASGSSFPAADELSSIENSVEMVQPASSTPMSADNFSTPPESPEKVRSSGDQQTFMDGADNRNQSESICEFPRNSCDVARQQEDGSDEEYRIDNEESADGDYVTLSFDRGSVGAPHQVGTAVSQTDQANEIESSSSLEVLDNTPGPEVTEEIPAASSEPATDNTTHEHSNSESEPHHNEGVSEERSDVSVVEIEPGLIPEISPISHRSSQSPPSVVASTHLFPPMLENFSLTESELQLGKVKPNWIPDSEAPNCMLCGSKFTLVKRRHHCRACGRVLCNECCNEKAPLPYLEGTKDSTQRVCEPCRSTLVRIASREAAIEQEREQGGMLASGQAEEEGTTAQAQAASSECEAQSSPTTPRAGLLKRERSTSHKSVTFSDGVRPGSDTSEAAASPSASADSGVACSSSAGPSETSTSSGNPPPGAPPVIGSVRSASGPRSSSRSGRQPSRRTSRAAISCQQEMESFLPKLTAPQGCPAEDGTIPPPGEQIDGWDWPFMVSEGLRHRGDPEQLLKQMTDADSPPVEFAIKRNLTANIKLIKLTCCVGNEVWCIASQGLRCVAQDEIMILIERAPEERRPPFDVLRVFNSLYEEALKGNRVSEMDHTVVAAISGLHFGPDGFLGSRDHAGFLYIRTTFQCMRKLPVPDKPYLVGLLMTRSEVPWAKVLPMRLYYRLGAEFRVYPCPIVSQRFRKSMFNDIGHTIMNLLADFRNYSYFLPLVQGCHVHLEEERTTLYIPKSKHHQIEQIIQTAQQQHVLAWATDFSLKADSHLVCIQEETGANYHSQTVNIEGKVRKVTGSTFIVLNGALKAAGFQAKTSIVEDGVMAQIRPEIMETLVTKMKNKEDFTILLEQPDIASVESSDDCPGTSEQTASVNKTPRLEILWIEDETGLNPGYRSPIDGRKLEGLPCLKVSGKVADHSGGSGPHLLRMTELFVLSTEVPRERLEECQADLLTMGRHITAAGSKALLPFAAELAQTGLRSLGIRVSLGPDMVEFQSGAGGRSLPHPLMPALDSELVPLLYTKASSQTHSITVEIILRVLDL